MAVFNLFLEGGPGWMGLVTLLLIALFFAAWKAPAWVKEIGIAALAVGAMSSLIGLRQAAGVIQSVGDISPNVVWGGDKVMSIPIIYGIIVYLISLILRVIQKPRI